MTRNSLRFNVDKEVLLWAIQESQIPIEYIEVQNPQIHRWIKGEAKPTINQIKTLSNNLKIPFGLFFLSKPPQEDTFNVEFRTLNNKINHQYSINLKTTIQDMDYKKSWMSEYRQENGYEMIHFPIVIEIHSPVKENASKLRELFKISIDWQRNVRTSYDAFKFIREKIEKLGILVMTSGIVGDNTHRKLDIGEFRAFVLKDDYAPLIFINRNDTDQGLLFSLVHEFIHILVSRDDDIFMGITEQTDLERFINEVTAEFIVPQDILTNIFNSQADPYNEVNRIANIQKTSTVVVAIKAHKMGLINNFVKDDIIDNAIRYFNHLRQNREKKSSGGNYYNRKMSGVGREFATIVIHQAESGKLLYTDAYKLLGMKGNTYDKFKEYLLGK